MNAGSLFSLHLSMKSIEAECGGVKAKSMGTEGTLIPVKDMMTILHAMSEKYKHLEQISTKN